MSFVIFYSSQFCPKCKTNNRINPQQGSCRFSIMSYCNIEYIKYVYDQIIASIGQSK